MSNKFKPTQCGYWIGEVVTLSPSNFQDVKYWHQDNPDDDMLKSFVEYLLNHPKGAKYIITDINNGSTEPLNEIYVYLKSVDNPEIELEIPCNFYCLPNEMQPYA